MAFHTANMHGEFLPWTEKYRPGTIKDVIGQQHIKEVISSLVKRKMLPHLMFAGPPGVGKTTMAMAMAHELYGEETRGSFLELNASDERGIDIVRGKIKEFARSMGTGKAGFKIIFLDEADALTSDAQQALRRTMEIYSDVTRFILSCNYSSKIIEPIQSRCAVFRFLQLKKEDVLGMIERVEKGEGIEVTEDGKEAICYISEGDLRKTLNLMQGASFHSKKITAELVYSIGSAAHPEEVRKAMQLALSGKFMEARKEVEHMMVRYGLSGEDIIIQFYKELPSLDIDEKLKVSLIDRIGEYNFRIAEGANERIQIDALLAQFLLAGKAK
jgi:replication factor C small subunit